MREREEDLAPSTGEAEECSNWGVPACRGPRRGRHPPPIGGTGEDLFSATLGCLPPQTLKRGPGPGQAGPLLFNKDGSGAFPTALIYSQTSARWLHSSTGPQKNRAGEAVLSAARRTRNAIANTLRRLRPSKRSPGKAAPVTFRF
ncbi:hypothetical protein SKAU_G00204420 [Synaphobranchus kaupii]|uniref:Uncharacterized protein n=1 Tax=Synaphobranchus kaupii TaxID=118154 RepID=A0A9Q1FG39_SYNKA|nr:hypothetical protein SKAU_G00204420 [Synaphobranchus kaupii]